MAARIPFFLFATFAFVVLTMPVFAGPSHPSLQMGGAGAPSGLQVDWWASTPLPITYPLPPEALSVAERLIANPRYVATVMESPRGRDLVARINSDSVLQPPMEILAFRKTAFTGRLTVQERGVHEILVRLIEDTRGFAAGDKAFPREMFNLPTPRVYWQASPGASEYCLWRRPHDGKDWTLIYTGTQTEYIDPALRDGTIYDYRVGAIHGDVTSICTEICTADLAACLNKPFTQPRGLAAQAAYCTFIVPRLADALQRKDHVDATIRALINTHDIAAVKPLEQAFTDSELRDGAGYALARFGKAGKEALARLAKHADRATRNAAIAELTRLGD